LGGKKLMNAREERIFRIIRIYDGDSKKKNFPPGGVSEVGERRRKPIPHQGEAGFRWGVFGVVFVGCFFGLVVCFGFFFFFFESGGVVFGVCCFVGFFFCFVVVFFFFFFILRWLDFCWFWLCVALVLFNFWFFFFFLWSER